MCSDLINKRFPYVLIPFDKWYCSNVNKRTPAVLRVLVNVDVTRETRKSWNSNLLRFFRRHSIFHVFFPLLLCSKMYCYLI